MDNKNIVLIGFMGSGKTSVGIKLARAFDYNFIDTDLLIESDYGASISNIFNEKGEAAFREMETALLKRIVKTVKSTVIATGGGMPLNKENSKLLKMAGTVIFLRASKETTYLRISGDTNRPLLAGDDKSTRIGELIDQRYPIYVEASDHIIDTDNKSFYEIIKEVEQFILIR